MLAQLEHRGRSDRRIEQRRERLLAFDQRHRGKIVAVEVEEIEGEEGELLRAALGERVLKRGEARDPSGVLDDDLAVDQRLPAGNAAKALARRP